MSNTAPLTPSEPPTALALTPGEPAGIGPDLAIHLAEKPHTASIVCVVPQRSVNVA
jgi:4-hydroxy-L-threonine phosphate dehydrogenase PdxA